MNMRKNSPSQWLPVVAFLGLIGLFISIGCGGGGTGSTGGTTIGGSTGGTVIQGVVRNSDTLAGVPSVRVTFYTSGGTVITQAITNATGNYQASFTSVPARIHLANTSWPSSYYRSYRYRNLWHTVVDPNCRATLPTITPNVTTTLTPIDIVPGYEPPPPPPNGCP